MIELFQLFTVAFGVSATLYPTGWGVFFWRQRSGIGRVISYMLFGEAFVISLATGFSVDSFLTGGNYPHALAEAAVRDTAFAAALWTTVKLVLYLRKVQRG